MMRPGLRIRSYFFALFSKNRKIGPTQIHNSQEREITNPESEVQGMNEKTKDHAATQDIDVSEELRDVLIAISVVAKRLAKKLEETNENESKNTEE